MRYISNIAAAAALVSVATAGNAPVVKNNPIGITYSATFPASLSGKIAGVCKVASSPDGMGVNIQISWSDLPGNGKLGYAMNTGSCSAPGGVLDPYGGATGSGCATNMASCQVGDLSDKHGDAVILSGGSGTGYVAENYADSYLSMTPGSQAFFGNGCIVVTDSTGGTVACANFINANKAASNSNSTSSSSSSMASSSSTGSANSNSGSNGGSQSSSTSSGFAARTAAPIVGAGVLGLAAMLL